MYSKVFYFYFLKDILKSGIDSITSKDTLNNVLTSGITSGLTVGLTSTLNNNITIGNSNNIIKSLKESAISNVSSGTVQSIMSDKDFKDTLKDQLINTVVMAGANMGAKEIGKNYYNENISKAEQLLLHGLLGAGVSGLTGNDVISGAVSGVVGEVSGDYLKNKGYDKKTGSEIAGFVAGLSGAVVGKLGSLDDGEIVDSIYNGERLGKNASENNAYFAKRPLEGILSNLYNIPQTEYQDKKNIEFLHEQLFFEDEQSGNIGFFGDGTIRSDNAGNLSKYNNSDNKHYDDNIMREAVNNIYKSKYINKYNILLNNCQDYVEDIRQEYHKLINNNN